MDNKTKLLFVGRLAADTGILTYLAALKLLDQQKEPLHLDVYGDGDLQPVCKKYVEANHLDVTFHGFVKNAVNLVKQSTIVLASQYLTILEAMSKGCMVIAYADTAIKNDYLFSAPFAEWITITHSAEEIAAAILHPLKMNKHGVGWAKKQTWDKLGREYIDIWKK